MTQHFLTIHNQTPAQKNGKRIVSNHRGGSRIISSQKTLDWKKAALAELDPLDLHIRPEGRIQIDYMFYVTDKTQRDLDNMIASVNDILQAACADKEMQLQKNGKLKEVRVKKTGIIEGDHWAVLRIGSADAEVDKENPRCELTITEL